MGRMSLPFVKWTSSEAGHLGASAARLPAKRLASHRHVRNDGKESLKLDINQKIRPREK